MKITKKLLTYLADADTILDAVYETFATLDPNHAEEMASYHEGAQALAQAVPGAEEYLLAQKQELASDLRYALWLGFQWNLECFRNPVSKFLLDADFEELCRESCMHTLPEAWTARQRTQALVHSVSEEERELFDPITDHFAYLKTWGYKVAFYEGFCLADKLLPHLVPGFTPDIMLSMRLEQKLWDSLGVLMNCRRTLVTSVVS